MKTEACQMLDHHLHSSGLHAKIILKLSARIDADAKALTSHI
jgi:hypothetical protein